MLVATITSLARELNSTGAGEHIYCHPQTDCFVVSQLFHVARHTRVCACVRACVSVCVCMCVCVCVAMVIFRLGSITFIGYTSRWWCKNSSTANPCKEKSPPPPKEGVLGITLKSIWWWCSNSGELESMEYLFVDIIHRSTLTGCGRTCISPLYGSNSSVWNNRYSKLPCAKKKKLRNNRTKMKKWVYNETLNIK